MGVPIREESHRIGRDPDRPQLIDYLSVVEIERLDVGLSLWLGAVEIGLIVAAGGEIVHAELPGASGDLALDMLAELTDLRVEIEPAHIERRTVTQAWKAAFADQLRGQGQGRTERRAQVYARLRAAGLLASDDPPPASSQRPQGNLLGPEQQTAAEQALLELLHREAIVCYLRGDLERAQAAMRRGAALAGAPAYQFNLERLRLRILDEDSRHRDGRGLEQ